MPLKANEPLMTQEGRGWGGVGTTDEETAKLSPLVFIMLNWRILTPNGA